MLGQYPVVKNSHVYRHGKRSMHTKWLKPVIKPFIIHRA